MRISDWSSDVCSSDLIGSWSCAVRQVYDPGADIDSLGSCHCRDSGPGTTAPTSFVGSQRHRSRPTAVAAPFVSTSVTAPPRSNGGCHFQRSEEHTSELQSLMRISYAVFCLKKNTITSRPTPCKTENAIGRTHSSMT